MYFESSDLLRQEKVLEKLASKFFFFTQMKIYFPPRGDLDAILLLSKEKRLIIPLIHNGDLLGAALFEDVKPVEIKKLLSILPQIADLWLEHLILTRSQKKDFGGLLDSEASLFAHMEKEAAELRQKLVKNGKNSSAFIPLYKLCLGLVVIIWENAQLIGQQYDQEFKNQIFKDLAKELSKLASEEIKAACLGRFEGRYEFGLIFGATGRKACAKLATKILRNLQHLEFIDKPTGMKLQPRLAAGYALYPEDLPGELLHLPVFEQMLQLRDRARSAALRATAITSTRDKQMDFASICKHGGIILEAKNNFTLLVNLGKNVNAAINMRFNVVDITNEVHGVKGQIRLIEVREEDSLAEILFLADPANLPQAGDPLTLIEDDDIETIKSSNPESAAKISGAANFSFLPRVHFFSAFKDLANDSPKYVLGISRLENSQANSLAEFIVCIYEFLEGFPDGTPDLLGLYGENSVVFFHQNKNFDEINIFYQKLWDFAKKRDLTVASGCFSYPFLNFRKSESETCALKALEYARLLPVPHIGNFDSLALTISADKKYSAGDNYGAMEEYRLALIADFQNQLARNSLAVCLAALGKNSEAEKLFESAYINCGDPKLKAQIAYNHASLHHKLGNFQAAAEKYRQCVSHAPDHVFGWIRMGELREKRGFYANAKNCYDTALKASENNRELIKLAQHKLAQLEINLSKSRSAKERLHDSLLLNPDDAEAMRLLAKIYLDEDNDPAMAETLARNSLNKEQSMAGWKLLAQALACLGKTEEANAALRRAEKFSE